MLLDAYRRQDSQRKELGRRLYQDHVRILRHHREMERVTRAPRLHENVLVAGEEGRFKDRFEWPVGRIEELIPGTDGIVRAAKVSMQGRLYVRPIKSLIPLEGQDCPGQLLSHGGCGDSEVTDAEKPHTSIQSCDAHDKRQCRQRRA